MSEESLVEVINNLSESISINRDSFDIEKPFVTIPTTHRVEDLTRYVEFLDQRMDNPRIVRKRMQFVDTESFLTYFKKFSVGYQPQLFSMLSSKGLEVMCIFDYDEASMLDEHTIIPEWNENRAYLRLKYSRDYQEFRDKADSWFTQEEFALFVEGNTHLFVNPDGATMLELAQDLKGARSVAFQSGKNLHNGSVQLEYIETIDATSTRGLIKVPQELELKMPMYEGFAEMPVRAAFRWKLTPDKKVEFSYRLLTKVAEREAEDEVRKRITDGTGLPLLSVSEFGGITARP